MLLAASHVLNPYVAGSGDDRPYFIPLKVLTCWSCIYSMLLYALWMFRKIHCLARFNGIFSEEYDERLNIEL